VARWSHATTSSSLRREIFEELGIEIDIVRLTKIDAVPYVPEESGPYRLDFYYRCLPKQGFGCWSRSAN
jgi:8-oxo-dGTP pyrophosphatase MutT (NUDIX family)